MSRAGTLSVFCARPSPTMTAQYGHAVATACPYCAVMVGDGLAQKTESVPARDIAELVADALA